MELSAILLITLLATVFLIALVIFFMYMRKRGEEIAKIDVLLTDIADQAYPEARNLKKLLLEKGLDDGDKLDKISKKLTQAKRELLELIIQMFLDREPTLLVKINQLMFELAEPYSDVLIHALTNPVRNAAANNITNETLISLEQKNQQLVEKFEYAMLSLDQVTENYVREFAAAQVLLESDSNRNMTLFSDKIRQAEVSAADLEAYGKKIVQLFADVEVRIQVLLAELNAT